MCIYIYIYIHTRTYKHIHVDQSIRPPTPASLAEKLSHVGQDASKYYVLYTVINIKKTICNLSLAPQLPKHIGISMINAMRARYLDQGNANMHSVSCVKRGRVL